MSDYFFATEFQMPFEAAEKAVRDVLAQRGFGVLTSIDVEETLRSKTGAEVGPYKILGACNPRMAQEALAIEPRIGTMLPCNVILRQVAEGRVEVAAVDPVASMQAIENPRLSDVAHQVRALLEAVIHDLSGYAVAKPPEEAADDLVSAGSEYSFPASDPPSYMGGAAVAGPPPEVEHHKREPATTVPTAPEEVKPAGDAPQGTDPARVFEDKDEEPKSS